MLHAILLHLGADRSGHDVARLKLISEAAAVAVEQHGALATAALGDEEGAAGLGREEARGVDLHVIEMLARNTVLYGDVAGITRELRVVGRMLIHAADATGCPERVGRSNLELLAAARELVGGGEGALLVHRTRDDASAGSVALDDVDHRDMLEDSHVGEATHRGEELRRDLLARDVRVKSDARAAVRALAREAEAAVLLALEVNT